MQTGIARRARADRGAAEAVSFSTSSRKRPLRLVEAVLAAAVRRDVVPLTAKPNLVGQPTAWSTSATGRKRAASGHAECLIGSGEPSTAVGAKAGHRR